jgi:hypothetical protein
MWNFDLLPSPRASYCCRATLIYPEALIKIRLKIKTRRYKWRWRRKHCTQKERQALEGFIDENGGVAPGRAATKRSALGINLLALADEAIE